MRPLTTSKLIGTSSGKVAATTNGQAVVRNTTTIYKRYEGTGLIANTTIKALGNTVISVTLYYKNGKVDGNVKLNGMNAGVINGKWSASDTDFSPASPLKAFSPTSRPRPSSLLHRLRSWKSSAAR